MFTNRHLIRTLVFLAAGFVVAASANAADDAKSSAQQEQALLAVLRSDAPAAEKAISCKHLAIHGSSESVAELAKLLSDPHLSSWARIALEAIPGERVDEALRSATTSLQGKLLVGTINSIGVRRDQAAVDTLTARLKDTDSQVASAAAVALGRIGNEAAAKVLRQSLASAPADVRTAIAEGCVLSAERFLAAGNSQEATAIYDQVRHADVPGQRILEATRGAILARGQEGIPLLLEQFQSPEKSMFQLALGTVREFPGDQVDQPLAAAMLQAAPERAALMIQAMSDRPETVVLSAVLNAAQQGPKNVRLSAIDALRRVGDDSCLAALLQIAIDSDPDLAQAAKETLSDLPGENVDKKIVSLLPNAEAKSYPLLLELIGQRRIDAVSELLPALDHSDQAVRSAALVALGETVTLKRLSMLVSLVVSPKHPDDAALAQQALKAASIRMPDREACAAELANALQQSPAATKNILLEIIADVGGTKSLQTLAAAAKSDDPQLQDTASRLLGKWSGVSAAPVLLDLARNAPAEKYRIRALRGYISLARRYAMSDQQRAEMCRSALEISQRADEKKLVLDVLQLHPSSESLKLAIETKQVAEVQEEATAATLLIAKKLGGKGIDVSELLSGAGLSKVKLEIIKAEYGTGSTQKDVTEVVRKQASDSPLISLSSSSYNTSFGGDPLPGSVKRLSIAYRINGKPGEASFAENALIILPMPK